MEYFFGILIALDILGNAICGGHHRSTVSGRVGYFADIKERTRLTPYWKFIENVIDFAFKPLDGEHHCKKAYSSERHLHHKAGGEIPRLFLSVVILITCPPIAIITRLIAVLKR